MKQLKSSVYPPVPLTILDSKTVCFDLEIDRANGQRTRFLIVYFDSRGPSDLRHAHARFQHLNLFAGLVQPVWNCFQYAGGEIWKKTHAAKNTIPTKLPPRDSFGPGERLRR